MACLSLQKRSGLRCKCSVACIRRCPRLSGTGDCFVRLFNRIDANLALANGGEATQRRRVGFHAVASVVWTRVSWDDACSCPWVEGEVWM